MASIFENKCLFCGRNMKSGDQHLMACSHWTHPYCITRKALVSGDKCLDWLCCPIDGTPLRPAIKRPLESRPVAHVIKDKPMADQSTSISEPIHWLILAAVIAMVGLTVYSLFS